MSSNLYGTNPFLGSKVNESAIFMITQRLVMNLCSRRIAVSFFMY